MKSKPKKSTDSLDLVFSSERWKNLGDKLPANKKYRFDITGAGSWTLVALNGKIQIAKKKEDADCVLISSKEDFLRIVSGKQNLLTALLQGVITTEGDLGLLQQFHAALRKSPIDKI